MITLCVCVIEKKDKIHKEIEIFSQNIISFVIA